MVIADVLRHLDIHDLTDLTADNTLLDGIIERSVAQYMADHYLGSVFLCAVPQTKRFFFIYRKGFFQKHIITAIQERNRRINMLFVHGTVDD